MKLTRVALTFLLLLILLPMVFAVVGEGETYQVRHKPDYERFLNAFEPYRVEFLQDLRASKQTIYDARMRKTWPIESINDEWLMEILYNTQSRTWNHIQLPLDVLQYGLGTVAQGEISTGIKIRSGVSLYPSSTKHRTGGKFLSNRDELIDQEGFQITPEEITWVRLNLYSLRNPVTQKNVRVVTLSDEQIRSYLVDRKTRKIAGITSEKIEITPEKAKKELQTIGAYYRIHHQRFNLR
ncbi:MAG: hypothetical protein AABX70_01120 [Nanoarchaeota archaeon]